jgi:tetratricopeptide (TPR) repeat protein
MIVKNESHIIEKTLENICSKISFAYWVIVDTGSTDNTKEIITNFFKNKNIQGELHSTEWRDFAYNRTDALNKAYNKTDYVFIFDADDAIEGEIIFPKLTCDLYYLICGTNFVYKRAILISNRIKSEFKGVLHEYITFVNHANQTTGTIEGDYHIVPGHAGSRSFDPKKYYNDALVLEKAFKTETDPGLKSRYAFYCAQSYMDYGMHKEAIEWYKIRAEMSGWDQEVFYSYYKIGNMYYYMGEIEKAIYYWIESFNAENERLEAIYNVIKHYREKSKFDLAYRYYSMIDKTKDIIVNDKLFVTTDIYEYKLDFEFTIIAGYINKHADAIDSFKKLINAKLDLNIGITTLNNLAFYKTYIKSSDIHFFHLFIHFINSLYKSEVTGFKFNKEQLKTINYIIKIFTPSSTEIKVYTPINTINYILS